MKWASGKVMSILAYAAVLVIAFQGVSAALDWGSKELENEKLAIKFQQEVAKGGYKIVGTEELKTWIDKKEPMLLVDTMPFADSFQKQHIPGAVNFEFPLEEIQQLDAQKTAEFEKLLGPDKNRRLVFYCGYTKCARSHNGAMLAMKLGYKDVYRQPGGIKAWMEADYKTEKAQ
jgi:thiosulfate/3-mercaptopyruvate sulfurtransferase